MLAVPFVLLALHRYTRLSRLTLGAPTVLLQGRFHAARTRSDSNTFGGELVELATATPTPMGRAQARAIALDRLTWLIDRQSWLIVEWLP